MSFLATLPRIAALLTAVLVSAPAAAAPTTISFEDVGTGPYSLELPADYAGLTWTNFFAISVDAFPESGLPYRGCGAQGTQFCGFNGYGIQASFESAQPFNLVSLWAGIADVVDPATDEFRLRGYTRSGALKYDVVVDRLTGTTRYVRLNWRGVTRVELDRVTDTTPPTLFTVDNLVIVRR